MIDAFAVKLNADLLGVVSKDTTLKWKATTGGAEYAGPCPLCKDGDDRFLLQLQAPPGKLPTGARWMCRKCSPRWGDVISYVQKRHGIDFQAALEWLANLYHIPDKEQSSQPPPAQAAPSNGMGLPSEEWARGAEEFADECAEHLWSDVGKQALAYLHKRGLNDDSLFRWRIGFNPDELGYAARGITIPCYDSMGWHYVKVRRAQGEPRYKAITGSRGWLFGAETYKGNTSAFLFESELDVILAYQTGLTGAGYASIPAGHDIEAAYQPFFETVIDVIVCMDNDEPGLDAAVKICKMKSFHMGQPFPMGKDPTEFVQAGGDLLDYLLEQLSLLKSS